jgi:hypothetical protein
VADSGEQYDSAGMTPAVRARVAAQEPVLRVADDFANLRSDGFSGSRMTTPASPSPSTGTARCRTRRRR